jgi:hypothetical protein
VVEEVELQDAGKQIYQANLSKELMIFQRLMQLASLQNVKEVFQCLKWQKTDKKVGLVAQLKAKN